MTAEYEFNLTFKGTTEELVSMLKIMKRYDDFDNDIYLEEIELFHNEEPIEFDDDFPSLLEMGEDELINIAKEHGSPIEVFAWGPYGNIFMLNEANIFRELAEAAPGAFLEASIEGAGTYEEQELHCTLRNKILHISTSYLENDMDEEDAKKHTVMILL